MAIINLTAANKNIFLRFDYILLIHIVYSIPFYGWTDFLLMVMESDCRIVHHITNKIMYFQRNCNRRSCVANQKWIQVKATHKSHLVFGSFELRNAFQFRGIFTDKVIVAPSQNVIVYSRLSEIYGNYDDC